MILCYFIYAIIQLVKQPTNVVVLENGKLSQEETVVGYVVREETVIQGENYKNGMIQIKAEGEKVANGDSVFRYYSNNEEELEKKIQELDIKIQEAMESQTNLFSNDMKLLDKQIEEKLNEIGNTADVRKIREYKKDINSKITKKAKIAGELSPSGSYIRQLIEERSSYEKSLNSGAEYVSAPKSGIVSYRVDGLEQVLTPDSFSTLNKDYLEGLNLRTGEIVASSDECGKIVDNFEGHIIANMTSEQAMQAKLGDNVTLRLSNFQEIAATVEYIIEQEDSRILIFKVTRELELLSSYRKITFDVIWWSYSGLRVPNSSLLTEPAPEGTPIEGENIYYVVRNRNGYQDKILVKVLKQNDSYSIINNYETEELKTNLGYDQTKIKQKKNIVLYDEILLNPKTDG